MKKPIQTKVEFLPWEEIRPVVELAGFVSLDTERHYTYRNPAHHLILVDGGHVQCDPPGESLVALPGDLICFRPAERNRYATRPNTSFYQAVIEFAPAPRHRATPVWDDVGPLPVKVSLGDELHAMRRQFETICVELPQIGSFHQMRVRAAVFEMLAIIARLTRRDGSDPVHIDPWHRMRLALQSQLALDMRVDRLARDMEMSVNHFIRQFRKRFGATPKVYRTRFRLREAARLLREGHRSVKSVAFELGFFDSKGFTRRFRQHFGVNPSDLRPDDHDTPDPAPAPRDVFFNVNQYILPPYANEDYLERYRAK